MITQETIDGIRTVFRDASSGSLWGIPYTMNHEIGQTPKHIWDGRTMPDPMHPPPTYIGYTIPDPGPAPDWVWLGTPGWFGSMNREEIELVKAFQERLRAEDLMSQWPGEWQEVE